MTKENELRDPNLSALIEWRDWAIDNLDPSAGALMWAVAEIKRLKNIETCAQTLASFCDWAEPWEGDEDDLSDCSIINLSNGDVHRVWAACETLEKYLGPSNA